MLGVGREVSVEFLIKSDVRHFLCEHQDVDCFENIENVQRKTTCKEGKNIIKKKLHQVCNLMVVNPFIKDSWREQKKKAEGVYNQRLQNITITFDKVRYMEAPPLLKKIDQKKFVSQLWIKAHRFIDFLTNPTSIVPVNPNALDSAPTSIVPGQFYRLNLQPALCVVLAAPTSIVPLNPIALDTTGQQLLEMQRMSCWSLWNTNTQVTKL
ncbi:hypothetical protein SELMODRAFT_406307 [Selaginella moellendorffii]|uniref:ATXR3 C-terminal domain-containing protein n=1 Tax=Selaginella moellendorffii TaxID=88036 RepID=D8R1Y4_SELML|nr:hypothetical protein SELMODRAFT_406307 [Selaginella moellendorffii]